MKKITTIFVCCALFLGIKAQTPYWNTTGNGGNTSTEFIGTTDKQPLIFKIRNTERMRLNTDGAFLGIGVANPLATLHLHYQDDENIPNSQKLLQLTTAATGNATNNGFAVFSDYTTKEIRFKQQESAKFFLEGPGGGLAIAQDGKVGFGTDAPQATLHLHNPQTSIKPIPLLQLTTNGTGNAAGSSFLIAANTNNKDIFLRQLEEAKFFIEGPGGGLAIAQDGKIGVGTDAPKEKLHIDEGNLLITTQLSGTPGLPAGSLLFADVIDNSFPHGKWGIVYLNSNDPLYGGYGLDFRKFYDQTVPSQNFLAVSSLLFLSDNGRVGIGDNKNPQALLDVSGSFKAGSANITGGTYLQGKLGIGVSNPLTNMQIGDLWTFQNRPNSNTMGRNTRFNNTNDIRITAGAASRISFNDSGEILLQTTGTDAAGSTIRWNTVTVAANGDVGIGTTTPSATLDVRGTLKADALEVQGLVLPPNHSLAVNTLTANNIRVDDLLCAKEIKVQLADCWPDYVFSKDYNLMPLREVEDFITENQHLPNVPSAAEVEANGINVGEMNAILLKKMEEMTLYIIALQKQIDELKK